jgi:hypothetical protein
MQQKHRSNPKSLVYLSFASSYSFLARCATNYESYLLLAAVKYSARLVNLRLLSFPHYLSWCLQFFCLAIKLIFL